MGCNAYKSSSSKERRAPEDYAFPDDPRKWEQTKYRVAELSPLGKSFWAWINGEVESLGTAVVESTAVLLVK